VPDVVTGLPPTVKKAGADKPTDVTLPPPEIVPQDVFVPSVVKYLPLFPDCDGAKALNAEIADVWPVPPFVSASVPAKVIVPELVIGPPLVVRPVVPPATLTEVTVPALAAGVAHVPSPRQNVVAEAEVPEFRLVTGKLPVMPVESGRPVALVKTPLAGVPSAGVVSVGLVSVRPAMVAAVAPSATLVDPIVTDELVSPALGMVVEAVTALAPLAYI